MLDKKILDKKISDKKIRKIDDKIMMMKHLIWILLLFPALVWAQPSGTELLDKIDKNMSSKNQTHKSKMIINGARSKRTLEAISYVMGDEKSFTEYLAPARDKGTKMLKLDDKLWIFSPSTDRTIQISGHMLRQSMMGSDLSYEDMMDDKKMSEAYDANVTGSEMIDERDCWLVELHAKSAEVAYQIQKIWVDKTRFVPLKQEMYAKSGKLLKRMELKDIVNDQNRWYPKRMLFKDMLKKGDGTEFIVLEIQYNAAIPEHIFSKAGLR